MSAGNTTALLRRITSKADLGKNMVMVKARMDTRYATDAVVTHDGVRFPCWALPDLSSFEHRIGSNAYEKVRHVDSVVKPTARCEVCCKKACFTMRKTQTRQRELIGGSDIHMLACQEHYLQLQPDIEKEVALVKQIF